MHSRQARRPSTGARRLLTTAQSRLCG
jgi:hypothetical protein